MFELSAHGAASQRVGRRRWENLLTLQLTEAKRLRRGRHHGREQAAAYYDQCVAREAVPYEQSPWRAVYDAVASFLPPDRSVRILDIGCGAGRCAEALRRAGYTNYTGLDFSAARVNEAKKYLPDCRFLHLDAFSLEARQLFSEHDVFLLTEVLEHIDHDKELLARIPVGSTIVFSVPNFEDAAHVRIFETARAAAARYQSLLKVVAPPIEINPMRTGLLGILSRFYRVICGKPRHRIFVLGSIRTGTC